MKIIMSLAFFIYSANILAVNFKVMSFNTMCDICSGSSYSGYSERQKVMQQIIKQNDPDLISFQEFRSKSHVEHVLNSVPDYSIQVKEGLLYSFADPAIAYKKSIFSKVDSGSFWLGPREGGFSFGWKFAVPRQVQWVKLVHKKSKKEFVFVSSHIDNRIENLTGSAAVIANFIKAQSVPVIFAADTNMTVAMPEYKKLTLNTFGNAFDMKWAFSVLGKYKSGKDLCYSRKGSKFPSCRVDHILLHPKDRFKVKHFIIDTMQLSDGKFPSDHRPVIVSIILD